MLMEKVTTESKIIFTTILQSRSFNKMSVRIWIVRWAHVVLVFFQFSEI